MTTKGPEVSQIPRPAPTDAELDEMQWTADAHADDTVAAIVGPWPAPSKMLKAAPMALSAKAAVADSGVAGRLARIDQLNKVIGAWDNNAEVAAYDAGGDPLAIGIGDPLQRFVSAAKPLPDWAEEDRIERAEKMFMDYGALSVTMLFCASLPECYVIPDLAAVLNTTGQLVKRTEHRIRTTGAMIFPVMMRGGLTSGEGSGIAQILKVRLIHAAVRNLILRSTPEEAVKRMRSPDKLLGAMRIPPLAHVQKDDSMASALFVHGWELEACALPNNQEELAYTLLTFSYVFLRSMRRLGIPLTTREEEDYLHTWNVAGHFLGIRRELMVDTMDEAEKLFARMQARGRMEWARHPGGDDPRPALGGALMDAMKSVIPEGVFKPFPVLLTRFLLEAESSKDLGLDGEVSPASKFLFMTLVVVVRCFDWLVRLVFPDFSVSRLLTRAMGYRLTCALLMSQTKKLSVPDSLHPGIVEMIKSWSQDPKASSRMNSIEDRLTTGGEWKALPRDAPSDGTT